MKYHYERRDLMFSGWSDEQYAYFDERAQALVTRCAVCHGEGLVDIYVPLLDKTSKGPCKLCSRNIECLKWVTHYFFPNVGRNYRQFRLPMRAYTGSTVPIPVQKTVFKMADEAASSGKGIFLLGPSGTGKTALLSAHYLHDLVTIIESYVDHHKTGLSSLPIFKLTAKKAIDENIDFKRNEPQYNADGEIVRKGAAVPTVSADKIKDLSNQGHTVIWYLDELDKTKISETGFSYLFDAVRELEEQRGRLSCGTNETWEVLQARFGDEFMNRIRRMTVVIDLFKMLK
jgi:hypothetical protein